MSISNAFHGVCKYIDDKAGCFNQKIETTMVAFEKETDAQKGLKSPWSTTVPGYLGNPFINSGLTVYHGVRTLERVVKTIGQLGLAIFSSLGALMLSGENKKLNNYAAEKWIMTGLCLYGSMISAGLTGMNLFTGLYGLLDSRAAIHQEVWMVQLQNRLNKELSAMPAILHEGVWLTKSVKLKLV